jgi:DNA invertase Pin-like site-specific DNA recombinase
VARFTLLLSMLGAVTEFDRSMILERQREGIALAKAAGKYQGRKAAVTDERADELRARLAGGESVTALARSSESVVRRSITMRHDLVRSAQLAVSQGLEHGPPR